MHLANLVAIKRFNSRFAIRAILCIDFNPIYNFLKLLLSNPYFETKTYAENASRTKTADII